MQRRTTPSIWKGAIAGAAGGIAGSWAMHCFQAMTGEGSAAARRRRRRFDRVQASDPEETESGDATVEAAQQVARQTRGRPLDRAEQEIAGPAMHYAFGGATGALYGATREFSPRVASGFGMPFGASVWLGAVELALPALGLMRRPTAYPASMHAVSLGAHLVYGATAEAVRRGIRRLLR